jgi:L-iditol 2-dehydrogenase
MLAPRAGAIRPWPLADGEVTIEVSACGLCRREFGVWNGSIPRRFPDVLGHEVAGTVLEGGWPAGTPVAGMGNQGLARHIRVPRWQVAPVAGTGPEFTLVEPLACAVNAIEQDPSGQDTGAVVFGLGILGQFLTELLVRRGRTVLAVDNDAGRREVASAAGADVAPPSEKRLDRALSEAGAVYECTGVEAVLWRASVGLPPGAALILVAHHQNGTLRAGDLLDQWHVRGIAVRNAVPRTATDMASCVKAAARAPLDLSRYRLRLGGLGDTPALLDAWPQGEVLRHVITMDGT